MGYLREPIYRYNGRGSRGVEAEVKIKEIWSMKRTCPIMLVLKMKGNQKPGNAESL